MRRSVRWLAPRLGLGARMVFIALRVVIGLRRRPLPDLVHRVGTVRRLTPPVLNPFELSRFIDRNLRLGTWQPRCLISALVLYRLLRLSGYDAELVIGLPASPVTKDAHAWVEMNGLDVGPPPGRGSHIEFARYS